MKRKIDRRAATCSALATILLAAAVLASAAPLPEATPEDVGVSSQRLERLTQTMQGIVDSGELAGMVVLVARQGKLVYQKSFGMQDKSKSTPMSLDSIFRIYSMTKPVVTVAAMILVEEGKLGLDEAISKYLPEFKDMKVGIESFDPATGAQLFYTVPAKRADHCAGSAAAHLGVHLRDCTQDAGAETVRAGRDFLAEVDAGQLL